MSVILFPEVISMEVVDSVKHVILPMYLGIIQSAGRLNATARQRKVEVSFCLPGWRWSLGALGDPESQDFVLRQESVPLALLSQAFFWIMTFAVLSLQQCSRKLAEFSKMVSC